MGELENDDYVIPAFLLKVSPKHVEVEPEFQEGDNNWIQSDYPEDRASLLKERWNIFKLRLRKILLK